MRRRRTKFTWFPTLGTLFDIDEEGEYHDAGFQIETQRVPGQIVQAPAQWIFPVTRDFTTEPSYAAGGQDVTLRDAVEGQDWLLKRLVGKLFVAVVAPVVPTQPQWDAVRVTAGFFVARSDDQTQNVVSLGSDEINTMGLDNIMDPWIWRRSFFLSSRVAGAAISLPASNNTIGSMMDGPHIDSKVARRIRREHRLWFSMTAVGYNQNGDPSGGSAAGDTNNPGVCGWLDLRILGTMRKAKNSSSF